MAIHISSVTDFLNLRESSPVLDVRSPNEYAHAHIPNAISLPLFTDAERALIGTAYKQRSKEEAIKIGLAAFGPRMLEMVEKVEKILNDSGNITKPLKVRLHCWRGGMRSGAVAWLLDLYGFNVYLLKGGYKNYRKWVLETFEAPYSFKIIGGNTGSGKTPILLELQQQGYPVIDLEGLAKHKGSAFGDYPGISQPGQEQFENDLAEKLYEYAIYRPNESIFLEDESQRIGLVNLPASIYQHIRNAAQFYLDIPFEARLEHILTDYSNLSTAILINAIIRIKKRLGPLETKTAINFLLEEDRRSAFRILLGYYDKHYRKSMSNRNIEMYPILCEKVDIPTNFKILKKQLHV